MYTKETPSVFVPARENLTVCPREPVHQLGLLLKKKKKMRSFCSSYPVHIYLVVLHQKDKKGRFAWRAKRCAEGNRLMWYSSVPRNAAVLYWMYFVCLPFYASANRKSKKRLPQKRLSKKSSSRRRNNNNNNNQSNKERNRRTYKQKTTQK